MSFSVAVVAGGPSTEANVSRTSAKGVAAALVEAGHRAAVLELDSALAQKLLAGGFDVVFPVTHGPLGEDGCLQGLLEVLELPYVGSAVLGSALAASKPHAKRLFRAAGLPLAADALVERGEDLGARAGQLRAALGPALVVKPASGGSAIATTRIRDEQDDAALTQALAQALDVDRFALVEQFIEGKEVTCGVLETEEGVPQALPPTLILAKAADWYDFTSRYAAGGSEHQCPAPLGPELTAEVQRVAVAAHRALSARDLSRVDFVVADGGPVLLEVNTLPGMTATSLYPEAAAVAGVTFSALCDRLARRAYGRGRRDRPTELDMP